MWTNLETTYRQKKAGSCFNAYDDLFSIRKSDDESLQSLINRVDESMKLCQSLRPKDFDLKALDKELTSMVLIRALPDEYSHFVSSLLLMDKLDKDTVQQVFRTEEIQRHRRAAPHQIAPEETVSQGSSQDRDVVGYTSATILVQRSSRQAGGASAQHSVLDV